MFFKFLYKILIQCKRFCFKSQIYFWFVENDLYFLGKKEKNMFWISIILNEELLQKDNTFEWIFDYHIELHLILKKEWFWEAYWWFYLWDSDSDLTSVYRAIDQLKKVDWVVNSMISIKAFNVSNLSDFTEIIKK